MNTAIMHLDDCRDLIQAIRPCWYPLQQQGLMIVTSPTSLDVDLDRLNTWRQLYIRASREFLRIKRSCQQVIFIWRPFHSKTNTISEAASLSWQMDAFSRIIQEEQKRGGKIPVVRLLILDPCEDQENRVVSQFDQQGWLYDDNPNLPFLFSQYNFAALDKEWHSYKESFINQINLSDEISKLAPELQQNIRNSVGKIQDNCINLINCKKTSNITLGSSGLFDQLTDGRLYDDLNKQIEITLQSLAENLNRLDSFKPSKVFKDFLEERLSIHREYGGVRFNIVRYNLREQFSQDAIALAAVVRHLVYSPVKGTSSGRHTHVPSQQINVIIKKPVELNQALTNFRSRLKGEKQNLTSLLQNWKPMTVQLLEPEPTGSNTSPDILENKHKTTKYFPDRTLGSWLKFVDHTKEYLDNLVEKAGSFIAVETRNLLNRKPPWQQRTIRSFSGEIDSQETILNELRNKLSNVSPFPAHEWPEVIAEQNDAVRELLAIKPLPRVVLATLFGSTVLFLMPWIASQAATQSSTHSHFFANERYIYPVLVLIIHLLITAGWLLKDKFKYNKQALLAQKSAENENANLKNMFSTYLKSLIDLHRQGTIEANISLLKKADIFKKQQQEAVHCHLRWLEEHQRNVEKLQSGLQTTVPDGQQYPTNSNPADILSIDDPEKLPYQLQIYHFPIILHNTSEGNLPTPIPGVSEVHLETI